jgi:hypothetical protein
MEQARYDPDKLSTYLLFGGIPGQDVLRMAAQTANG